MKIEEIGVGVRVKCIRPFAGVPQGTEGVIDQVEGDSCVVAWDHPESRLPSGYREYDGVPALRSHILRDGFSRYELRWLASVRAAEAVGRE